MSVLLDTRNGRPIESPAAASPSLPELLGELTGQVVTLGRQELQLAKAELKSAAQKSLLDSAGMAGGLVLAHAGMLVLFASAASGLALLMPLWAALLVVGLVSVVVGAMIFMTAKRRLQEDASLERLPDSLERTKDMLKESLS